MQQTVDFIKKNYERKYRVTLSFNDENIGKAIEVYRLGVENCLGIVEAIIEKYGYRYRRMENFLRECKLWKEREGWLHWKVLTKLYLDYEEDKASIRVDVLIKHLAVEFLIGQHDINECEAIFWDLMVETGMEWVDYIAAFGTFSVGDDTKQHEVGYMISCSQEAEFTITLWRKGKIMDSVEGTFELENYRLYGVIIC